MSLCIAAHTRPLKVVTSGSSRLLHNIRDYNTYGNLYIYRYLCLLYGYIVGWIIFMCWRTGLRTLL